MIDTTDAALANMLQNLPPEVADRVVKKYEAERTSFLEYVRDNTPSKNAEYWAKRGCTKCYGRGILGALVRPTGETVTPTCPCTSKNYMKWLKSARRQYTALKKEQGHETTTD